MLTIMPPSMQTTKAELTRSRLADVGRSVGKLAHWSRQFSVTREDVKNVIDKQGITCERSSLPSKNFPCISMDMLQIGALVLLGSLVEALGHIFACRL